MSHADKMIVVTGGSQGIGLSIAGELSERGYPVVLMARNIDKLHSAASGLTGRVFAVSADVGSRQSVAEAFRQIRDQWGPVYGLINNAGLPAPGSFLETDPDRWEQTVRVHVHGAYYASWFAAKQMAERGTGRIVNIASAAGVNPPPGLPIYAAAKGALIALTRALAVDLAANGVTVNAVCPGPVDTETFRKETAPDLYRERSWSIPLGSLIRPEDIARTCAFLCSEDASRITGETILVDGGAAAVGPYAVNLYKNRSR